MQNTKSLLTRLYEKSSIRYMIFLSFTFTALIAIVTVGVTFYLRFSNQLESTLHAENQMLVEQVSQSLNTYLRNTIYLSDTLNFKVIKNADISESSINEDFQLLYEANTSNVRSISLFSADGEALVAMPLSRLREGVDVTQALWFRQALDQTENLHFFTPTVQNLFRETGAQYNWVIPLASYTEITQNMAVRRGVLRIDLKYGSIVEQFRNVSLANSGYLYLIDQDGTIIYHPQHQLVATGLVEEVNLDIAAHRDGEYRYNINDVNSSVIVRRVGYTGWAVIGIIPQRGLTLNSIHNILFILIILSLYFGIIIFVNAFISNKLTTPIKQLELSVRQLDAGAEIAEAIYMGGSHEIQNLSRAIRKMVRQLRKLTDDIVREQGLKQKSELNALQAQINPHFLYNTLDIIVWMIEKNRHDDALKVVSALGRFFRLSLSRGNNIITVADELDHVRNYLIIQQMRYKNKFHYTFKAAQEVLKLATIKLVLQPIAENAIYHGMEYMLDSEGEINISAYLKDGHLYMRVEDNGLGMPKEKVKTLLTHTAAPSMGSGIGLMNVNERIALYFGAQYGVIVESEPDEGTSVTLHLPAIPYEETEDNK